MNSVIEIISLTLQYEYFLFQVIFQQKKYNEVKLFAGDDWARVQLYSLGLIFRLWSLPHYRSKSLQQDMIENLRNVAIPGTGVPLSIFCQHWVLCLIFVAIANPIICMCGAINKVRLEPNRPMNIDYAIGKVLVHYSRHLLHPDDWFSFWRLNCQVVSYHSHVRSSSDYKQEDKWTFLKDGRAAGVPVSPFMDISSIVCKNKNIEGGMGIHFYENATHGGDWIIQEKLDNAGWLNALLPNNAPLSTLRIITASTWSLGSTWREILESQHFASNRATPAATARGVSEIINSTDAAKTSTLCGENYPPSGNGTTGSKATDDDDLAEARQYVHALSGVLRLGRKGASTDHSSVLFDVDLVNTAPNGSPRMCSGRLGAGTTNRHWYALGVSAGCNCPWLPPAPCEVHPDEPYPQVTGKCIPNIDEAVEIVTRSHMKMMKDVPLVGWDVAFTSKGICLLEVNLSCNFFRGSFDIPSYVRFIEHYWKQLDKDAA